MGICYGNTLNGLVEKKVVKVRWIFMKGRIVFDFTTQSGGGGVMLYMCHTETCCRSVTFESETRCLFRA